MFFTWGEKECQRIPTTKRISCVKSSQGACQRHRRKDREICLRLSEGEITDCKNKAEDRWHFDLPFSLKGNNPSLSEGKQDGERD